MCRLVRAGVEFTFAKSRMRESHPYGSVRAKPNSLATRPHPRSKKSGYCRPISRVLSSVVTRTVISLGVRSPVLSSSLPAASFVGAGYPSLPIWPCSRWGLPSHDCYQSRGELLPPRFTLTCMPEIGTIGGLLSVALSVDAFRHRPGVTWQRALWSPDFPRVLSYSRPSGRQYPCIR